MKHILSLIGFIIFCTFIIPSAMVWSTTSVAENDIVVVTDESVNNVSVPIKVLFDSGEVKEMELEEYLIGVVSAEMPASFDIEALKAQAVAARTYSMYKKNNQADPSHNGADVCTLSTHCKAYIAKEDAFSNWGEDAQVYYDKICSAVNDTKGEIIKYNDEPILAVFHASSGGGRTENSEDVWGGSYPYLVSVDSLGEEQDYSKFYSSETISFPDFKSKILSLYPDASINSADDISIPTFNEGGSVKNIIIGGKSISGVEMRSIFNLRSACFTIEANNDTVTFSVSGYGHGVGMSQYGANHMAKEGNDYISILKHYYSGVDISSI